MRKGGEEKGARGARTAPSVDGIVFIFLLLCLCFSLGRKVCCYVDGFLPLGEFSFV
jgi:hypothetical protein